MQTITFIDTYMLTGHVDKIVETQFFNVVI